MNNLIRDVLITMAALPLLLGGVVLITLGAESIGIDPQAEWYGLLLVPLVLFGLFLIASRLRTGFLGFACGILVYVLIGWTLYTFFPDILSYLRETTDTFLSA